ncbi:ATP-binding protein [Propionicicella superfundia]|uniref:ATP-binding protein n=1 Tax=Propionicicella superfundia TaxID=348582 RepID=UPI0003FABF61|nr:ATP-binding protein [Propionicicella superfundia]
MDEPTEPVPVDPRDAPDVRRASRSLDDAWVGGVCSGLAHHLGWPVLGLRVAFVALGAVQFIGVAAYLVLWLALPVRTQERPVGLEAATRSGHRTEIVGRGAWGGELGLMLALVSLGVGLLALPPLLGIGMNVWWLAAGATGTAGVFALWSAADKMSARPVEVGTRRRWVLLTRGGWLVWLQVTVGVALLGVAGWTIVFAARVDGSRATVLIVVLVVAGIVLVGAPVANQARFSLAAEREARLVAAAHADMAAHLHDSVLQTLALIQRQADNPQLVARLARRQERELREWLYGDQLADETLAAALKRVAADVEDNRGVVVELVVVGDTPLTDGLRALVRAAGEAILNAAKHSGEHEVDVYAEVDGDQVEVFVRDRGVGFDVETVAADRQGVRGSILDRMARHGGRAQVRSTPGVGTEVRLEMRIA